MIQLLTSACQAWPLAQRDAWESLGNRFSGDHAKFNVNDLWTMLGVVFAGVAFVWLLRWVYNRQQSRRLSTEPRHLFIDLCRAHRLRRVDRKRLMALAEFHDLPMAALLFVQPEWFSAENLPDDDNRTVNAYESLAEKLFAGLDKSGPRGVEVPAKVSAIPVPPISMPTPASSAESNV